LRVDTRIGIGVTLKSRSGLSISTEALATPRRYAGMIVRHGNDLPRRSLLSHLARPNLAFVAAAAAALIVAVPVVASIGAPNAFSPDILAWHEPAITVHSPVTKPIAASQFGADIVNFVDPMFGTDSEAPYPSVHLGMVRLWDDGTTWADIEPRVGKWNFSVLDHQVALARSEGAQVLYVLGQTPEWASSDPVSSDIYGQGDPAPPAEMSWWRQYVSTIAARYKGKIAAYEVWDEADASTFHGTPRQMVQLATVAYQTIKGIDPAATVLTPSFTQYALTDGWLSQYLSDGGGSVADALAGHAYASGPEAAGSYLLQYEAALEHAGLGNLPVWMTEVGFQGFAKSGQALYSGSQAEAYVARTFMDQAEGGSAETIWYGANSNGTWLSLGEQGYGQDAGAYSTMIDWLSGSDPQGCGGTTLGAYTGLAACYLIRPNGSEALLLYDSQGTIEMDGPSNRTFSLSTLSGKTQTLKAGSPIDIGAMPVMVILSR
jgi:polysaccharide biosynthesis protein PslG